MEKHKADSTAKVLTLAFEKAATAETRVSHPWRYFIAGGETLQQIETIISDYSTVAQGYADLAKKAGAKSYDGTSFEFDHKYDEMVALSGTERVDYNLSGGAGNAPWQDKRILRIPGFVVSDGRSSGQFYPDVATPEGRALRDDCKALKERAQPAVRFAQWLGASGVEVPVDPQYPYGSKTHVSASVTKIGEDWIVAVPVIATPNDRFKPTGFTEEWIVPPGATPLGVSEYFGLLEKNSLIKNTPKAPKP